jgi:hypothetical protein
LRRPGHTVDPAGPRPEVEVSELSLVGETLERRERERGSS